MPIFEYVCENCEHPFETLLMGAEKAACPKCHSKKLTSKLSVFAVQAKRAEAVEILADRVPAPCPTEQPPSC
jgi:putative FmdB family regulatory protein